MSGNPADDGRITAAPAAPRVSVIMANFRGAAHLAAAMRSVLAQTERRLELIVADDASDDDSVEIARGIAATDDRVRVIAAPRNGGPAATRNLALDAASGDWIAIVDSDDLIHPDRIARLMAAADAARADLVADDLVHFGTPEGSRGRTLLQSLDLTGPMTLDTALYLRGNGGDAAVPAFGYLKPMIRRDVLADRRYDPALRIGEDYDLVLRLLIGKARFVLLPDPLYAYRRHGGSISHRLSVGTVAAMLAAHRALPPLADAAARRAARAVDRQLRRSLRYERLTEDVRARRWGRALVRMADPAMVPRLLGSLRDRQVRRAGGPAHDRAEPVGIPDLPPPGRDWSCPPATAAARITVLAGRGEAPPPDSPPWALWLACATA